MAVIGLTGKNGSGKGEVAELLKQRGFQYSSLSDALRTELREKGEEISRMKLVKVGRALRARYGAAVLACRIGAEIDTSIDHVIDSVRNPAEAEWMKDNVPGFQLWNVTADARIRFTRIRARQRESDPQTLEAFLELEAMEATATDSSGQDLEGTARLADAEVANNTTLDELQALVSNLLNDG